MLIKSIFLVIVISEVTAVQQPKGGVISVQGNVNQSTNILIPFNHLVSATISQMQYRQIIVFSANRFRLHSIKQSQALPKSNKTLLQQLTSPFTNEYIHIFRLSKVYLLFKMPNHFLFLQQKPQSFTIKKEFFVSQMNVKNTKFQTVNEDILIIYLSNQKLILVRFDSYKIFDNIFNTTNIIFSKSLINDNGYKMAYFSNKMYQITFSENNIELKQQILLPVELAQIKVIVVQTSTKGIWMVDAEVGLVWLKTNKQHQIEGKLQVLLQQKGCYQLDIKSEAQVRVLLTCTSLGQTFFIKALLMYEKQKPILVKQWSPHIEQCKTKKFIFYKEHIFSLQKQSLDIFLPSIYKGEKDLFYTKNWISLTGHSAYLVSQQQDQLYLYSVNNFQLSKSKLILEDYSLQIKSNKQLKTQFNLTLQYVCPDSSSAVKQICVYEGMISVNIHNKYLSFTQARSINIGVILLFGTCIMAISYICYMKYKNIEEKVSRDLKALTNPTNYKL